MTSSTWLTNADILGREMRLLSAAEYHRMIEAGVFDEDEDVELLEGVVVAVSPQKADHAIVVERLADPAFTKLPPQFLVRCQLPLLLSESTEPEPDVAVIDRSTPRSRERLPTTARLIFEVASEFLRKDREVKGPVYARAGISEYVIANLRENCLEVRRDPDVALGHYRTSVVLRGEAVFSSEAVPGLTFTVADLLL